MNTSYRTWPAVVLAIAALTAAGAAAAQPSAPGPMSFGGFDRDGDGVVTEQEFATVRGERMAARAAQGAPMRGAANAPAFSDIDSDGDGKVVPAEFAAHQAEHRQQMMAPMAQ